MFPQIIPADARDISFHYNPAFLQGGEVFRLSYTVTAEDLSKWTAMLGGTAEWVGSNEEWHHTNNWGFSDADSIRYHLYWDGEFNHGEMSYVLIDPSSFRIPF